MCVFICLAVDDDDGLASTQRFSFDWIGPRLYRERLAIGSSNRSSVRSTEVGLMVCGLYIDR